MEGCIFQFFSILSKYHAFDVEKFTNCAVGVREEREREGGGSEGGRVEEGVREGGWRRERGKDGGEREERARGGRWGVKEEEVGSKEGRERWGLGWKKWGMAARKH